MKQLFFLLLFVTTIGTSSGQQTWVPQGAEWHYGFLRADPLLNIGYIKINAAGDTVILGKSCKILDQIQIRYTIPTYTFDTTSLGKVYTYADSTRVYTYKNNRFYTLYDFGAAVGTIWTVCWFGLVPPDTGQVMLDAVDVTVINGIPLKTLHLSTVPGSCIGWMSATVVERIGCINEYLFPDYSLSCGVDLQIGGTFRCYQDDTFPIYSVSNSDTICEYVLQGTGGKGKPEDSFNVSPNPASDLITIESSNPNWNKSVITLYSMEGRKVREVFQDHERKINMDVSSCTPGLYILIIRNDNGFQLKKKITII